MRATVRMMCESGATPSVAEFHVADLHFWPLHIGMRTGDQFFGEPIDIQVNWEDGTVYRWVRPLPVRRSLWTRLKRWLTGYR